MSEKRAPRTVRLPDAEGGPELDLISSNEIWEAVEDKFGGSLGTLYLQHLNGHVRWRFMVELVWRCARKAGSVLTLKELSERCYALGAHRLSEVVDALWLDIMKPSDPADEGAAPGTPLASGD